MEAPRSQSLAIVRIEDLTLGLPHFLSLQRYVSVLFMACVKQVAASYSIHICIIYACVQCFKLNNWVALKAFKEAHHNCGLWCATVLIGFTICHIN